MARRATGGSNHRFFERIEAGRGCNTLVAERAASWFREHWPTHVFWPPDIPREPVCQRCAAE